MAWSLHPVSRRLASALSSCPRASRCIYFDISKYLLDTLKSITHIVNTMYSHSQIIQKNILIRNENMHGAYTRSRGGGMELTPGLEEACLGAQFLSTCVSAVLFVFSPSYAAVSSPQKWFIIIVLIIFQHERIIHQLKIKSFRIYARHGARPWSYGGFCLGAQFLSPCVPMFLFCIYFNASARYSEKCLFILLVPYIHTVKLLKKAFNFVIIICVAWSSSWVMRRLASALSSCPRASRWFVCVFQNQINSFLDNYILKKHIFYNKNT